MLRLTAECEALGLHDIPLYKQSMAMIEKETHGEHGSLSSCQHAVVPFLATDALPADPSALMIVSHMLHLLDLRERKIAFERDLTERRRSIEDSRRRAREAAVGRLTQLQLLAGLREGARSSRRVVGVLQRDRLRLERQRLEKEAALRRRYFRLAHVAVGATFAVAVLLQRLYLKATAVTISDVHTLVCSLQPSHTLIGMIIGSFRDWIWLKHMVEVFEMMERVVPYPRYFGFQFLQQINCGINLLQSLVYMIASSLILRLFALSYSTSMTLSALFVLPWHNFTLFDGISLVFCIIHVSIWLYILYFLEQFSKARSIFEVLANYYTYPLMLVIYFYLGPSLEANMNEALHSSWTLSASVSVIMDRLIGFISVFSMG